MKMVNDRFDNFAFTRLRALVEAHRARWGISPKTTVDDDGRSRLALRLSLWGRHAHATHRPEARCFECRLASGDLMKVAGAIVGDGCFQRAIHAVPCCIRAEAEATPDRRGLVNVEIALAESADRDGRRTYCDGNCIPDITARLRALGAKQVDS